MSAQGGKGVFEQAIQNFLGPILPLLHDPNVSEIMINGPKQIFVEKAGRLEKTDYEFPDEDSLRAAANNIAQSVGRRINNEEPTLDARLPDGSRIHVVIPPMARNGTTIAIRKFSKKTMTFKDYIKIGAITQDAAQFLDICMYLGKNVLVSGGTGSGKTTLLNVLGGRVPKGQRLLVIEDASELGIEYEHMVSFETRMANQEGKGEVTIRDLLKSALRLRPDRIIVGEVRGSEALELIYAMNTGHKGCMGTIHANSAIDALVRLESLALGGDGKISQKALQHQIGSAVNMVVQISRLSDGSRKIVEISEVRGVDNQGNYQVSPIYSMSNMQRGSDGRIHGHLVPTGELPSFMAEIESNKIPFPRTKFSTKQAA